jgi:hypothetical protein
MPFRRSCSPFSVPAEVYASVCCCASETTLKHCLPRSLSACQVRELHDHGVDLSDVAASDGAYTPEQLKRFRDWREPRRGGHSGSSKVSFDAVRLKKARLLKTVKTVVALHGNRARFVTVTCRECIVSKKQFLYEWECLRKALAAAGFTLKCTGMLERQRRGAFHLHAVGYLLEDSWDYSAINRIAAKRGFNLDIRELGKARRTSKKISAYMLKLDAVVIAAYVAKMETGDDYVYTLTSKGCDLPRRFRIYDREKAAAFIEGYGFRQQEIERNGRKFFWHLLESEAFSRDIYDTC